MIADFDHSTPSQRVLFGAGKAPEHIALALDGLDTRRALIVGTASARSLVEDVATLPAVVATHFGVGQHVPVAGIAGAQGALRKARADAVIAIGGGSAIGLAKLLARDDGLPIVAVPTTYAGSEATAVWGHTADGRKTTGTDPRVLPRVVVYDPVLTAGMPTRLAVSSGLNAVAHAVDSLWAPRADPINRALGTEGLRGLVRGLRELRVSQDPVAASGEVLYGAYLAARAFASAGSGLHHKICHVLGGAHGLDHAGLHSVLLPYVAALNAPHAPQAVARIAEALGGQPAVSGLFALQRELAAPSSLRELGMAEQDVARAAALTFEVVPASDPAPVSREDLEHLITAAWAGRGPSYTPDRSSNS